MCDCGFMCSSRVMSSILYLMKKKPLQTSGARNQASRSLDSQFPSPSADLHSSRRMVPRPILSKCSCTNSIAFFSVADPSPQAPLSTCCASPLKVVEFLGDAPCCVDLARALGQWNSGVLYSWNRERTGNAESLRTFGCCRNGEGSRLEDI